mmetsp:Transcript_69486/g.122892  ORF Transcript_69486/g.122892 Transcript_69486/m.122892 type:complete len:198 (+) Transcript_69486:64-657(+)
MFGGLFSWFGELFRSLGLLSRKNAKICFLGLDNAGKTTLLQMLKEDRISALPPTQYPNHEELIIKGIRFKTHDLGGHETARRIWQDYLVDLDGIVFLVDAADRTRFQEAHEELHNLLAMCEEKDMRHVPIAILGNKIDIQYAASEDDFRVALGLHSHMTMGKDAKKDTSSRPIELFMCSIVKRMGYAEAFDWLAKLV